MHPVNIFWKVGCFGSYALKAVVMETEVEILYQNG
jgi:hypothetical protein